MDGWMGEVNEGCLLACSPGEMDEGKGISLLGARYTWGY